MEQNEDKFIFDVNELIKVRDEDIVDIEDLGPTPNEIKEEENESDLDNEINESDINHGKKLIKN